LDYSGFDGILAIVVPGDEDFTLVLNGHLMEKK
jgi:hypothetical protein